ncbi:methyltransferase domain-containing protein [Georgenia alba]|uniref:Methyltransferase domain-containing protein n=1 Tax=Georgenia alba TaxID=2233858 RepID=A0ABW2Q7S0_9MICO
MSTERSGDVYTHGHHPSVLASHTWRTAENSAAYLLDRLRPGQDLLDVGCGPGTITAGLAARLAPGRVVGLDRDAGVLEKARGAVERDGLGRHVELVTGDVYDLPFRDARFDVVHAHQVLQHLTDPVAALGEMRRVLRPGGLLAVRDSDYAAMTWYPDIPGLGEWNELYHRLTRANGAEADAGRRLHVWVRQAGFTELEVSAGTWCFQTTEERTWWSSLWADRVTASAFARQALEAGFATEEDLARLAAAWRAWGEDPEGWFTVLHGQVLARR